MSTSKGNSSRTRPQKYQNKTAFKNDLHDTSHRTKFLNTLDVTGVCKRCKEILEWKIKYKKYKPLTAPAKCVSCSEKSVKFAYHVLCTKCVSAKKHCAKCCKPFENTEAPTETLNKEINIEERLKHLPERKRRTILRYLKKSEGQQSGTSGLLLNIEDILSKVDKMSFEDDPLFSDVESSDEDRSF